MRTLHLVIFLLSSAILQAQNISVYDLSCDHRINPAGIGEKQPRLSWKINSTLQNTMQGAYEIRVSKGNSPSGQQEKLLPLNRNWCRMQA